MLGVRHHALSTGRRLHVIARPTGAQAWAEADRLSAGVSPERIAAAQARPPDGLGGPGPHGRSQRPPHREEAERVGVEALPLVTAPVAAAPGRSQVVGVPTR
ncbi:hypothetical protein [Micromonospora sp. WMMD1155]|uniref:hypothetical protein n=1 Tax=Micromonospora sp. WMMD1155 TaxID=3016094 RepID=UPI00249AE334|nr:hypothetical protein [Micromonospora sp. WMMD1155]WFE51933.1 hypothetical protein O7617_17070 [Micromonospora sp. WMMD1155]